MALPTSYMTGSFTKIPNYFDTLLTAKAPDKFTAKFMSDLGFTSSNDRQFVNVLKAIGFLDDAGTPTQRYFRFLDQSCAKLTVAEGIKEAYADLFALNVNAHRMSKEEVIGKFKTLTNGSTENATIGQMASTFLNLCAYADWTETPKKGVVEMPIQEIITDTSETKKLELGEATSNTRHSIDLNYDIHIHLPATRDQAVYDALFASLAKHIPLK